MDIVVGIEPIQSKVARFTTKLCFSVQLSLSYKGSFGSKREQNPAMKNLPLKTRIVTRMISPWITHLGKSRAAGGIGVSKLGLNICP